MFDVAVKLAEGEKGAAFFGTAGVAAFAQAFVVLRGRHRRRAFDDGVRIDEFGVAQEQPEK